VLHDTRHPQEQVREQTKRLLQEFWKQGDEERRLGVPISMLCDRATGADSVPKGQLGFINFIIQPFFSSINEVVEEAKEAIDQLSKNMKFWQSKDARKATYKELFDATSG